MRFDDIAKYLIDMAEHAGIVKHTDEPTWWDVVEDALLKVFLIVMVLLIFI